MRSTMNHYNRVSRMNSERGINAVPEYPLPSPGACFLASENAIYEYGTLYGFARKFRFLYHENCKAGSKVVIISDSSNLQVFIIASCWLAGIPFSVISPSLPAARLEKYVEILNPGLIYCDEKFKPLFSNHVVITSKQITISERDTSGPSMFSSVNPEKIFGFFFTSGSVSNPKLVPLKRRQMLYAAYANEQNFRPDSDTYWLLCLPLNHIGGISIILRSLLYGNAIYRMERFAIEQVTNFLTENKLVQAASLVPTMLHRLLLDSQFRTHKSLKAILLGGGPASPELINKAMERGIPVVLSYGMTETCAQIAANPLLKPSGTYSPKASAGKIFPPNNIQIRNENGKILLNNESGLIWLKGPQVFDGYSDKGANEHSFDSSGWFNTGDFGHINSQDYLFIESRRSDLIITGGENVNPVEIENELKKFDEVIDAAVVGIPDEEWGEKIIAFLVLDPETDISGIIDSCKSRLNKTISDFKIPKEFIHLEKLPRTDTGKLQRNQLKNHYPDYSQSLPDCS